MASNEQVLEQKIKSVIQVKTLLIKSKNRLVSSYTCLGAQIFSKLVMAYLEKCYFILIVILLL